MLSEKMSRLRLGLVNDKIEWKQDDEIGQLVLEYNRMIDELGRSAEVLARSEREGAWREMARQVAHEIKNPLTPMKLSAQHLQKAWIEKAPDMDERLGRFTRTLIEQIDTLSVIASDFSSFAKMPAVINERINLKELILFVLSMYRDTSEIQYDFHCVNEEPYLWADRALLIRIFTNLLNNAIQAIGDSPGGLISIHVSAEQLRWIIEISDNGSGISAERAGKIFQPDFTTKTGGMGLGLAIVKSIVAGMHGEISFTSQEHEGTTFILKLPADDQHKQYETV
jgi:nitrogen fixation/metabolism regulation signal transduction histidine kinase